MATIFLSYRRADSADATGRIFDRLVGAFGRANVFKDVDSIPLGAVFAEVIADRLKACDAVLVVIGRFWLDVRDKSGNPRLHNENDLVRIEVEQALASGAAVVPVLVGGVEMPPAEQLPESLRKLTRRNAISVRPDPDFHRDMDRLIGGITALHEGPAPPQRDPLAVVRQIAKQIMAGFAQDPPKREPPAVVRQRLQPLDCTGQAGVSAADVRRAQEEWAAYLGRQVEETVEIGNGVTMTFVLVPPGKFRMGSPTGEAGRDNYYETPHTVVLTKPFDLGKTEVTQAQYKALTGREPSKFKGSGDLPVEQVSWIDARDYAADLTKKLSDRYVYRLPTEAEWEYACRGGRPSSQPFGVGNGRSLSFREANFNGNHPYGGAPNGDYLEKTCKVGSYPANSLGLCDMHGNVWEWCVGRQAAYDTYEDEVTDPTDPGGDLDSQVIRGGGWNFFGTQCRAASRRWASNRDQIFSHGFRLARSVPPGDK
jgi:formylglycine-generating enzyme required for sulfatase activity